MGVIHFFRSFISFLRSFISFLRGIFYSPRGDFETSTWKSLFPDTTPFRYVVSSKLLLRPSPRRHPTRHSPSDTTEIGVTAFDAWNCRADVACVGADLRVRPQNRLRSGEDGRTHRSAPTVGAPRATYHSDSSDPQEPKKQNHECPPTRHSHASVQRATRLNWTQRMPSGSTLSCIRSR